MADIEPGGRFEVPRGVMLPDMLSRVRQTVFADRPSALRHLAGGYEVNEAPTRLLRLSGVDLVGGVLYCSGASRSLRRGPRRLSYRRPPERPAAVLYESWVGNSYFGNWLADDTVSYLLTERLPEPPVCTRGAPTGHIGDYQRRMTMTPATTGDAHFARLCVIDDLGANDGQRARTREQRRRLVAGVDCSPHPGVFLLRGRSGELRNLVNEMALAEMLAAHRGVTILDPQTQDAATLIAACAGARVAVGIEGSQLAHAVVTMGDGCALLAIQPPDRVVAGMKLMTDRRGQHYCLLVGQGHAQEFRVDPDEMLASFDLAQQAAAA